MSIARTALGKRDVDPCPLITAPTPIFADGHIVVASGRHPERPIFVVRPTATGDITLPEGRTSNGAVAWSRTGRGPYMPTPLVYNHALYVLANNGVFHAYKLATGEVSDGTISGNRIAFKVLVPDGNRTVSFAGILDGDEIAFGRTVQVHEGGTAGGRGLYGAGGAPSLVAKRVGK
jgi:hypothetical protein